MPDENPGDSNNALKYITEDQIGNIVNAAVTNHLKRFTENQLPKMLEASLKPIADKLSAPASTPDPEEKGKSKVDPQVAALSKQLEDMQKAMAAEREGRIAAEKKQREDRAFSDLKASLAPKVRPELLDMLANHLFKVEGRVEFEEDGSAVFKYERNNYGMKEEVRLPIKDGVDAYLNSDAAKPFIPAPGTSQTTPVRKSQTISLLNSPTPFDPAKASDEDKLKYAREIENRARESLKAQGRNV